MALQDLKKEIIINHSLELFLNKSIKKVTIKDIASSLNIGEATIYRYFRTKENLITDCAISLEKKVYNEYFKIIKGESGKEKLCSFYDLYLDLFKTHAEYYRFVLEFDYYIGDKSNVNLEKYEFLIDQFKTDFIKYYDEGIKDGSLKKQDNVELFYYSSSKALFELCKKESNFALLKSDSLYKKEMLILTLINIIKESL